MNALVGKHQTADGPVVVLHMLAIDADRRATIQSVVRPGETRGGYTFQELWDGPGSITLREPIGVGPNKT